MAGHPCRIRLSPDGPAGGGLRHPDQHLRLYPPRPGGGDRRDPPGGCLEDGEKGPLLAPGRHRLSPAALREGTGRGAAGGRSLPRHGRDAPYRPTSGPTADSPQNRPSETLRHRPTDLPDERRPQTADLIHGSQRLHQDRRWLFQPLLLLRDPLHPRQGPEPNHRRHPQRGGRSGRKGGPRTDRHRPGYDGLRPRPEGQTDPEPAPPGAGRRRRAFLDPPPLHLPRPSDGGAPPDDCGGREDLPLPGYPHPAQR